MWSFTMLPRLSSVYLSSILSIVMLLLIYLVSMSQAIAASKNGFELSDALIPEQEIFSGGPPRDGIPAIDLPDFIHADNADFLQPDDRILGVQINGQAKAYPIRILNWHEIVNDRIGAQAFAVTFCPLCGTGVVFDSTLPNGQTASFGVSGLLYNSDVLLYDRETESLWSQMLTKAVTGPMKGQSLTMLPVRHTSWAEWKKRYPDTLVLSTKTGYFRDYSRNPYSGYEQSQRLYFSVSHIAPNRYHPKERVLGIEVEGHFKAYPFYELNKNQQAKFDDQLAGKKLQVHWQAKSEQAWVTDSQGREIPAITGFWFAWYTFHPNTEVFQVK